MNHLNMAACGAIMLAVSGTSFAWDARTEAADHVVYWGGATASTLSAQELTVASTCDSDPTLGSDTTLFYVPTSATNGAPSNDWAIACRGFHQPDSQQPNFNIGKTGLNGKILIVKRDRGGSGVGVGPVQSPGSISFLSVTSANCTNETPESLLGSPSIAAPEGGTTDLVGCGAVFGVTAQTEIGTSDIEPDKFAFTQNIPVLDIGAGNQPVPYDPAIPYGGQATLGALLFNTPVTLALRNKLQEAQFPATSPCHPLHPDYAVAVPGPVQVVPGRANPAWGETEACMPSLARHEINSLLTGKIADWNRLLKADGTTIGISGAVNICRRVKGSGSQATINALVSSYPCDPNRSDNSTDIILPLGAPFASEGSGSGDVASCLVTRNNNATNPYGIGVLSVEGRNTGISGANSGWRYIKIDGYAPTLQNVHKGAYWLWAQQSMQYRAGISSNKVAIFNALAAGLNSPTILAKLNKPTNAADATACLTGADTSKCAGIYTFGETGWLATPTASLVYDNVLDTARPVNAFTREVTSGKANICQTPVKSNEGGNALNGGRGVNVEQ